VAGQSRHWWKSVANVGSTGTSIANIGAVEIASPPSVEPDLDYDLDEDAPLRFRRIDNVLGPAAVPSLAKRTRVARGEC
jgi:hypothetical protein